MEVKGIEDGCVHLGPPSLGEKAEKKKKNKIVKLLL